jgi:hypothetical protein
MSTQTLYIIGLVLLIIGIVLFIFLTKKKDATPVPNPNVNPNVNPNGKYIVKPGPGGNPNCWSDPTSCEQILASRESGIQERLKCLKYKDQLTAAECDELEDADNYDDGCDDEYRNFHDFACKNVVDPIRHGSNAKCNNPKCDPSYQDCYNQVIEQNRQYLQHTYGQGHGTTTTDVLHGCQEFCESGAQDSVTPCKSLCENACANVLTRPH